MLDNKTFKSIASAAYTGGVAAATANIRDVVLHLPQADRERIADALQSALSKADEFSAKMVSAY